MSNQEILAILLKHEIRTVGDLDHYADVRNISRWHALSQLVGQDAADRIIAAVAVKVARQQDNPVRAMGGVSISRRKLNQRLAAAHKVARESERT